MPTASTRVPQQERSRATQARLLEATVECLWSTAGPAPPRPWWRPARGLPGCPAAHHYPTKAALVTAAVTHLTERRAVGCAPRRRAVPAAAARPVVDLLAAAFTGPLFVAALELWVAARTDAELRDALVPLEARVGREMHRLTVELLGVDERRPGVREAVQATLDLLRGLGVANLLSDDSTRRAALLHTWKRQLAALLTPDAGPRPARGPH
ncbi:TetR family transcriptional regulator [Nonomuraea sp. TT08I-71]|nr:TetR family transcriptional regulator [Nonomuraea sp. TT08I-71]